MTARDVREVIRARRLRDQFFERGLFEDPAWDMLLDLFAAELEQTQVSVSSLCIAARGRADHGAALDRQDDRGGRVRAPRRSPSTSAARSWRCRPERGMGCGIISRR